MIPESLTVTGLVSGARPVVSAFGDVLALALTLSLGFFVVRWILSEMRGVGYDLEGRIRAKRGYVWDYDDSPERRGYWKKVG